MGDFKHPQPFTLAQVSELDIGTLAEGTTLSTTPTHLIHNPEITRLQNSLHHLQSTQNELQLLVDTMSIPDVEFSAAIQENKDVMYAITSPVS